MFGALLFVAVLVSVFRFCYFIVALVGICFFCFPVVISFVGVYWFVCLFVDS